MSIRIKLILTYIIMVGISTVIITVAGMSYISHMINDISNSIVKDMPSGMAIHSVIDIIADFKQIEKYEPEKVLEPEFTKMIDNKLEAFSGFLVVETEGIYNAYYEETLSQSFYNKLASIPSVKEEGHKKRAEKHVIEEGQKQFFVIKYVFLNEDKIVNYYIVVDATDFYQLSNNYGNRFLFLLTILILIITLPLTYIVTKDIISPLKVLEKGALNIKSGNLDFSINSKGNNEISRVITAFEKMRSELKKSLDHQEQVEKNRKELISNISHDLKTPITSIKGYVEGIRDGVASSPEKLAQYLDVIYHKSEDMDRLIDDLFLFSKLDLHRMPFDMESVNISAFFEGCMEELHLEYDKQGITFLMNYSIDNEINMVMDLQKIKRVILNIISNSVKYLDKETKKIELFVEEDAIDIKVHITDNGSGIEQNELERIFDRFYRSDPSRNTTKGGTGLGLAIAKQIVEQHEGSISASSKKNEWTTISFTIPKQKGDN